MLLTLVTVLAVSGAMFVVFVEDRTSVIGMIGLVAAVGLSMALVAHYALFKPMHQIAVMAEAIGAGDYSKRLGFARHDELGVLARAMDKMCEELEGARRASDDHIVALDQLRHSDRVATLGRLASSVAHELGNPLNVIELRAQLIASGDVGTLEQAKLSAAVIVEQSRRMTRIISEILSFARMRPAKITRLDLVSVLRKAIALSEHTAKKHKARIVFNLPERAIEIDGDADKLLQIIVNLAGNGIEAMPPGGSLTLSVHEEQLPPPHDPAGPQRNYLCIGVADQGVGIPPDRLAKVFEPFFSTKMNEGGTGLGLSVAQGIAREHEGWISVESELGTGSSFKVHLPKDGLMGTGTYGG